ncbi:hypothetical protein Taro_024841, partial [Colocasia esculenta]|nr:hypothetical protein [Colocasia esculenta]
KWRAVVGIVLTLGRTSRDVRRGVSSRLQHPRVPRYYHHRHLWTTTCSCKVWSSDADTGTDPGRIIGPIAGSALVPQEHAHGGLSIMERFKRMALPSFKGESQPLLAESWLREVEKIFCAIRCTEEDKVSLVTYMLQERADVWWASMLRTRCEDEVLETLDEALSAAYRHESKMDQYMEEKKAAQKRSAAPF